MSQSNVIIGTLALAFVVFVTAKGELGTYLGFLGLGPASSSSSAGSSGGSSGGLDGTAIGTVENLLSVVGW